jgi:tetratricopeptide (TPR) repeat protein
MRINSMETTKQKIKSYLILFSIPLSIIGFSQESILYKADSLRLCQQPKLAIHVIKQYKGTKSSKYYQFLGNCYQTLYEKENNKSYYKSAKNNFKKCIKIDANNYFANSFIADDFYDAALYQKAITHYKSALLDTLTFKNCGFFPTHLYGDLAIVYNHIDSLNAAKFYFNKIKNDSLLFNQSWYFNHWLQFSVKLNHKNDTVTINKIYQRLPWIRIQSLQDSLEILSIVYFLNDRVAHFTPNWESPIEIDGITYELITKLNRNQQEKLTMLINSGSCSRNFFNYMLRDFGYISSEDFAVRVRADKQENIFNFNE